MKKLSQVAKAIKLMQADANITPKEMSAKLGLPIKRTYVVRSQAMKRMGRDNFDNVVDTTTKAKDTSYLKNLEAENRKLSEWTMLWKQKYDKLEQDYTQAKVMYLNSEAVVAYLERKVLDLLNSKGE